MKMIFFHVRPEENVSATEMVGIIDEIDIFSTRVPKRMSVRQRW
eukprot:UN11425